MNITLWHSNTVASTLE